VLSLVLRRAAPVVEGSSASLAAPSILDGNDLAFAHPGGADVWFAGGHLEWEAPLDENPYFIEHLHQALVGVGAKPHLPRTPRDEFGRPWRALPLRRRLALGVVGATARTVVGILMLPLIAAGLVVVSFGGLVRRLVQRLLRR
jgi:prepilin-type processing-associated H-X9-DG protein